MPDKVSILGAGNMGTALARLIAGNGFETVLWSIEKTVVKSINVKRVNRQYLPEVKLPAKVSATGDLKQALASASLVVWALPTQAARSVIGQARRCLQPRNVILTVAKGLDVKTGRTVGEILKKNLVTGLHEKIAALMGPLFASEIAGGVPSIGLLAAKDREVFKMCERVLANKRFFLRFSDDVKGAELGGALKNIYAILLGACDGLGYGWNAKSAAVAAAMRELADCGHFLGAKKETLYGLAGLGDLLTTGFGAKSRNRRFGEKICQGKSIAAALKEIGQVVEGAKTVEVAVRLLKKFRKETPLLHAVHRIVHRQADPRKIFAGLLARHI